MEHRMDLFGLGNQSQQWKGMQRGEQLITNILKYIKCFGLDAATQHTHISPAQSRESFLEELSQQTKNTLNRA